MALDNIGTLSLGDGGAPASALPPLLRSLHRATLRCHAALTIHCICFAMQRNANESSHSTMRTIRGGRVRQQRLLGQGRISSRRASSTISEQWNHMHLNFGCHPLHCVYHSAPFYSISLTFSPPLVFLNSGSTAAPAALSAHCILNENEGRSSS